MSAACELADSESSEWPQPKRSVPSAPGLFTGSSPGTPTPFPRWNGVGVPGEDPVNNPGADGTDRFGCGHSDDSESANSQAADIVGAALAKVLDSHDGDSER